MTILRLKRDGYNPGPLAGCPAPGHSGAADIAVAGGMHHRDESSARLHIGCRSGSHSKGRCGAESSGGEGAAIAGHNSRHTVGHVVDDAADGEASRGKVGGARIDWRARVKVCPGV